MVSLKAKFKSAFTGFSMPVKESQDLLPVANNEFAGLHDEADNLSARSTKLRTISSKLTMVWGLAFAVTGVCMATALLMEPSLTIEKLHVPMQIQNLFESAVEHDSVVRDASEGRRSGGLASFANSGLEILNGTFLRIVGGVMIFGGILSGVVRLSPMAMIAGVGGGLMLLNMPVIIESILVVPGEERLSAEHIPQQLSDLRYKQLLSALDKIPDLAPGERAYVLGQAAIAENILEPTLISQAAAFVREGKATFEIPASIAFAIESQAGGDLQSPKAIELRDVRLKNSLQLKEAGWTLFKFAMVTSSTAALLASLALYLGRRVRRIKEMLSLLN